MQARGSYSIALTPAYAYAYAYADADADKGRAGQVLPNTTLIFDIEIVDVVQREK